MLEPGKALFLKVGWQKSWRDESMELVDHHQKLRMKMVAKDRKVLADSVFIQSIEKLGLEHTVN